MHKNVCYLWQVSEDFSLIILIRIYLKKLLIIVLCGIDETKRGKGKNKRGTKSKWAETKKSTRVGMKWCQLLPLPSTSSIHYSVYLQVKLSVSSWHLSHLLLIFSSFHSSSPLCSFPFSISLTVTLSYSPEMTSGMRDLTVKCQTFINSFFLLPPPLFFWLRRVDYRHMHTDVNILNGF